MRTRSQIEADLEQAKQAVKSNTELLRELGEDPVRTMANELHFAICRWSHEDQCFWGYEKWDKPGSTRKRYLDAAEALLNFTDYDTVMQIMSITKGL